MRAGGVTECMSVCVSRELERSELVIVELCAVVGGALAVAAGCHAARESFAGYGGVEIIDLVKT